MELLHAGRVPEDQAHHDRVPRSRDPFYFGDRRPWSRGRVVRATARRDGLPAAARARQNVPETGRDDDVRGDRTGRCGNGGQGRGRCDRRRRGRGEPSGEPSRRRARRVEEERGWEPREGAAAAGGGRKENCRCWRRCCFCCCCWRFCCWPLFFPFRLSCLSSSCLRAGCPGALLRRHRPRRRQGRGSGEDARGRGGERRGAGSGREESEKSG